MGEQEPPVSAGLPAFEVVILDCRLPIRQGQFPQQSGLLVRDGPLRQVDVFRQKQAGLDGQLARLDEALSQAEGELARARASAANAVRFMRGAREKFLVGSVYEKREIAQALGIRYGFDRGEVSIETHPALMPHLLIEVFPKPLPPRGNRKSVPLKPAALGLKMTTFETRIIGSGSTKKAACAAASSFGGANGTRSETEQSKGAEGGCDLATARLYAFFRECLPFRTVSCVG